MASEQNKKVEISFKDLENKLIEENLKAERFRTLIEVPSKYEYFYPFENKIVKFHRWMREEASQLNSLPYAPKLNNTQELSDEEKLHFLKFKAQMVILALTEPNKWIPVLEDNVQLIEQLFNFIAYVSGLDKVFNEDLEKFASSDYGQNYGSLWFLMMRKTPSEVAELPESDVRAVESWFAKYVEKVKQ